MSSAEDPQTDRELLLMVSQQMKAVVTEVSKLREDVTELKQVRWMANGVILALSSVFGLLGYKIGKALGF